MNLFHIRQCSNGAWIAYDGRGTSIPFRTERSAWAYANKRNRAVTA